MKLADAHLHIFRRGYHSRYAEGWAVRNELILYDALRAAHGIERGLVVGYQDLPDNERNNSDVLRWAREHKWIAPLAFHRAHDPSSPARLKRERALGFVGIALYARKNSDVQALNDWPQNLCAELTAERRIISINAPPEALVKLRRFVESLENCFVLISHLGLPGALRKVPTAAEARRQLDPVLRMKKCAHVGVKLSGLYAISDPSHAYPHYSARPFIRAVCDAFGPERLYWGSDFSPVLEHVSFAQSIASVSDLEWSDADRRDIMGRNLLRILRIVEAAAESQNVKARADETVQAATR